MKKVLLLVSLLACSILCFSACGKDKVVEFINNDFSAPESIIKVEALDGYIHQEHNGTLYVGCKTNGSEEDYVIYNVNEEKIVCSFKETATKKYAIDISNSCCFAIDETTIVDEVETDKFTRLYDLKGNVIETSDKSKNEHVEINSKYFYSYSLFEFNGNIYSVDIDRNIEYVCSEDFVSLENIFGNRDSIDSMLEGHIPGNPYTLVDAHFVTSLDKSLNLKYTYSIPTNAFVNMAMVFDNGNYLIQHVFLVDQFSEDYDVIHTQEGENLKFNVVTKFVNVEKGKEKEVDSDYFFDIEAVPRFNVIAQKKKAISNFKAVSFQSAKYLDLAYGCKIDEDLVGFCKGLVKIEDKHLVSQVEKGFWIDKDGNFEEVEPVVNGQCTIALPELLPNGNFEVTSMLGQKMIITKAGEVVKQVCEDYDCYGSYYVINGNIYDSNFKKVTLPEGFVVAGENADLFLMDNIVITNKDGDLKLYNVANKSTKDLPKGTMVYDGNTGLYRIAVVNAETSKTTYTYYNNYGKELGTFDYLFEECVHDYKTGVILLYNIDNENRKEVYYLAK